MRQTCSGFRWILTGPFSCKPLLESFSGWVVSHFVLRQKAILHHLICSSHANKRGVWGGLWGDVGGGVNRTNSTSPPPHYTAHTRSPFWLWQKNNNNTIVFVGFANGRSWRTSPPHQIVSPVQVLVPVRGGVCPSLYPPSQPTNTYPQWTECFLEAQCCLHQGSLGVSDHMYDWRQVIFFFSFSLQEWRCVLTCLFRQFHWHKPLCWCYRWKK